MISKGCAYHLVRVKDFSSKTPSLESFTVAFEFPDVFSEDLLLETQPNFILPYKMALAKIRELKK